LKMSPFVCPTIFLPNLQGTIRRTHLGRKMTGRKMG
jgi:hypothetical protein